MSSIKQLNQDSIFLPPTAKQIELQKALEQILKHALETDLIHYDPVTDTVSLKISGVIVKKILKNFTPES